MNASNETVMFKGLSTLRPSGNSTIDNDQINSNIQFDSVKGNVNSGSIEKDAHVYDLCALETLARNAYEEAAKQPTMCSKQEYHCLLIYFKALNFLTIKNGVGDAEYPYTSRKKTLVPPDVDARLITPSKDNDLFGKLVLRPEGNNIIALKWLWKNKCDAKNLWLRTNLGIVAYGYKQDEGIDFDEFILLLLLVLSCSIVYCFDGKRVIIFFQMDVKTAFSQWVPLKREVLVIIMAQQLHEADVHPDKLCPPNKRYDLMDANKKVDLEHVQCPPKSKIMTNIIKNHSLRFNIAASSSVPWIYMA
ncbi:retrovirus-related pol polyprotein from transposon TNT 1-94 [Tanacetum coccineum]